MITDKKSRVLIFVDEANLASSAFKVFNKTIDWQKFRAFLVNYGDQPRELIEMVIYSGLPPATEFWREKRQSKRNHIQRLKSDGFMVYEKSGQQRAAGTFKANVDVVMAIDAMDLSLRIRPDIVVLVTGDADFSHLALTIRREGIKVEVAAIPQTLSAELQASANRVINLTEIVESFDDFKYTSSNEDLEVIVKPARSSDNNNSFNKPYDNYHGYNKYRPEPIASANYNRR
ncbi:MAG: NYN domain-containing protein [Deltaproteobacteria bacterium]|nr:NYN domain-containing protein [Deltaproteobacteria bacterium]